MNESGYDGRNGQAPRAGTPVLHILVSTDAHEVVTAAAEALAADPEVYQRGGALVRVVRDTSEAAAEGHRPAAEPRVEPVPLPTLLERLTAVAVWSKPDRKGVPEPALPPGWCVEALAARGEWPGIRHLEGTVPHPVLRPDGTVLATPGYDSLTSLLLEPVGVYKVPVANPGQAAAKKALRLLEECVEDFPFSRGDPPGVYKAAWVAALLTPLARYAFPGPAPLFLIDGNVPGCGKGLLAGIIGLILSDAEPYIATFTRDGDEMRKRITSLAMAGRRLVLLDNIEGVLGGPVLNAALTATSWSDRLLGHNREVNVPLHATWLGTGNNIQLGPDTSRRVCHIRLDSPLAAPEERTGFRHPQLRAWVRQNRGMLLAAGLTVLRGYCVAGRPDMRLSPWGSYEGWSALVRGAVVWAGLPDPGAARAALREVADMSAGDMAELLVCWRQMDFAGNGLTSSEVIANLWDRGKPKPGPDWYDTMRGCIENLVSPVRADALGRRLRQYRRRILGRLFIDRVATRHGAARWQVFPASAAPTTSPQTGQDDPEDE
jgi:hypothetical protein